MKQFLSILLSCIIIVGMVCYAEDDVITITIPPMTGVESSADTGNDYDESMFLSREILDDGTQVFTMTKEQHDVVMKDMKAQCQTAFQEFVDSSSAVKSIEANDDYTEINITVDNTDPEAPFVSFGAIGIIVVASYYQVFNAVAPDDVYCVINWVDSNSGTITGSYDSRTDNPIGN